MLSILLVMHANTIQKTGTCRIVLASYGWILAAMLIGQKTVQSALRFVFFNFTFNLLYKLRDNIYSFIQAGLPLLQVNKFYEVDGIMKPHQIIEVHAIRPTPAVELDLRYRAIKLANQFPELF